VFLASNLVERGWRVLLVVVQLFFLAPLARAGEGTLEVLHVYTCNEDANEVRRTLDLTELAHLFSVTRVRQGDFNTGSPADLSAFDAIVLGMSDGWAHGDRLVERRDELKEYVAGGGGIVWTHDSLETSIPPGPDAEVPAGVTVDGSPVVEGSRIEGTGGSRALP
jgi:hypothetical protein